MIHRASSLSAAVTCAALLLAACQGGEPAPAARVPPPAVADVQLILSLSVTDITLGDSAVVQWQTEAATACAASSAWSGARPVVGSETVVPTQTGVQVFGLRCTGAGAPMERSVTLRVRPLVPPTPQDVVLEFTGTPATLLLGENLRLTWSALHAQTCEAGGDWSGMKTTAGAETIVPAAAGAVRYLLTCRGTALPATAQVDATVLDPFVEAHAEFLRLRALENAAP